MRSELHLLVILPLLALAGCMNAPSITPPKPISFTQYPPFAMNVGAVKITEQYKSPMHEPNVEQLFRTTPAEAMRQWVKDRIKPMGGNKTLEVIIKDASVVSEPLPKTSDMFTRGPSERYTARLEVEMRIYGENSPMSEASINAVATRSDTSMEGASPADRDKLYDRMVRDLMALMNAQLERNFQEYFSNYIVYSPGM